MSRSKKEISTQKIKETYFKAIERIRKAYMEHSFYFPHLQYSNSPTLEQLRKAKSNLGNLKTMFEFNKFNEQVVADKASRLMEFEKEIIKNEVEIEKEMEEINSKIIFLQKKVLQKNNEIYEKFLFDQSDV